MQMDDNRKMNDDFEMKERELAALKLVSTGIFHVIFHVINKPANSDYVIMYKVKLVIFNQSLSNQLITNAKL